ncbi:serine/threonine-protein kinase [Nocardioides sp. NPDC006303]|uniref:serine/threonine-protein kinase n=1 Tax=Nocardioides sp. NPDC006303 TaxID=3156747 RepID=UPI0033A5DF3C
MSLKKGNRLTCDGVDYELRTTVGGGGSGDVWLADAEAKCWAIKVLRPTADRKKIERFDREASFQEGCHHDHIVPVVGRGEDEGRLFYIMPCYPDTLRDVINRGEADSKTLLSYVQQIGEALRFAHERGIVHRDVKPENVLVDGASAALADFGIAHFVDSTLTSAGDLVGNRDYRSPEQRRGQDARGLGPAADVYALGLIVNECFTREIPAGPSYSSIEASYPLMSYLDPIVARMLAQSPGNRPTIVDVLTDIRFFEAKKNDEIKDIEEALRLDDDPPPGDAEKFDSLFRQSGEDIWYAASLIASKTPDELRQYNGNWRMRLGYDADDFLRNLCVQSRLIDLCQRKFDYESNVYKRGDRYNPLDVDGDPNHRELYSQAQVLVSNHPLPPDYDLSGRILKTFASCVDYHCAEILSEARRIVSEVGENLVDAPILWMVKYLASYVPTVADIDHVVDHIRINWRRRPEMFDENDDDASLFTEVHPALDAEPVLDALKESWDVSITRMDDHLFSVMFRTPSEYQRFREHALGLATPHYVFEGDVMGLFRGAVYADGITQLTLTSEFDVCSTLAKILGLRDIL